jgi:hypothetical protein
MLDARLTRGSGDVVSAPTTEVKRPAATLPRWPLRPVAASL